MRLLLLLCLCTCSGFAISLGRPMGDAPDFYFKKNGTGFPHKIFRLSCTSDVEDTVYDEVLKFDTQGIGKCIKTPRGKGSRSTYSYYYTEGFTIDAVSVSVWESEKENSYSRRSFYPLMNVDTGFIDGEEVIDSIEQQVMVFDIAPIPGYPLERYTKEVTYIGIGDSTDSCVKETLLFYRWTPSAQGGNGYYRLTTIETKMNYRDSVVFTAVSPNKSDSSKRVVTFSGDIENDTTLIMGYAYDASDGWYETYREIFENSENKEVKTLSYFNKETSKWIDTLRLEQQNMDGAFTVTAFRRDTLSGEMLFSEKETHILSVNPEIRYASWESELDSFVVHTKDIILYDTTVVSVLEKGRVSKSQSLQLIQGELFVPQKDMVVRFFLPSGRLLSERVPMKKGSQFVIPLEGFATGVYPVTVQFGDKIISHLIRIQ